MRGGGETLLQKVIRHQTGLPSLLKHLYAIWWHWHAANNRIVTWVCVCVCLWTSFLFIFLGTQSVQHAYLVLYMAVQIRCMLPKWFEYTNFSSLTRLSVCLWILKSTCAMNRIHDAQQICAMKISCIQIIWVLFKNVQPVYMSPIRIASFYWTNVKMKLQTHARVTSVQ